MDFNILEVREAYNKNDLQNNLMMLFMEYEKKYWFDNFGSDYSKSQELRRCLDHCQNMINGCIKEALFYKYFKNIFCFEYREEKIGYLTTNRKHKGETDFYSKKNGKSIELKALDKYKSNEKIINELNDINKYKYIYHSADIVYIWLPYDEQIKICYKQNNEWLIIKISKDNFNILEKMERDYIILKVQKFILKGE